MVKISRSVSFEVGIFCVPFKNEFAWAGGEGGGGGGGGEVR